MTLNDPHPSFTFLLSFCLPFSLTENETSFDDAGSTRLILGNHSVSKRSPLPPSRFFFFLKLCKVIYLPVLGISIRTPSMVRGRG